jgi:Domain of unknown function (DUF4189)
MVRIMKTLAVAFVATLSAQSAMAAGAVASSSDKTVLFWSVHKPSEEIATDAAMSQCSARFGGDCVLEKSFSGGCIAVARSNSHRHWGYAWRPWAGAARYAAMESCDETGSHSCAIQMTSCE